MIVSIIIGLYVGLVIWELEFKETPFSIMLLLILSGIYHCKNLVLIPLLIIIIAIIIFAKLTHRTIKEVINV